MAPRKTSATKAAPASSPVKTSTPKKRKSAGKTPVAAPVPAEKTEAIAAPPPKKKRAAPKPYVETVVGQHNIVTPNCEPEDRWKKMVRHMDVARGPTFNLAEVMAARKVINTAAKVRVLTNVLYFEACRVGKHIMRRAKTGNACTTLHEVEHFDSLYNEYEDEDDEYESEDE